MECEDSLEFLDGGDALADWFSHFTKLIRHMGILLKGSVIQWMRGSGPDAGVFAFFMMPFLSLGLLLQCNITLFPFTDF